MNNYTLYFVDDIDEGYFPQTDRLLLRDNIMQIVEKAFEMADVSSDVTIYCLEYPTLKFEELQSLDNGHLSIGTAIDAHAVYFSPKIIWWKYYLDLGYRHAVQASLYSSKKLTYDQYLKEYITGILCKEIKRFEETKSI